MEGTHGGDSNERLSKSTVTQKSKKPVETSLDEEYHRNLMG